MEATLGNGVKSARLGWCDNKRRIQPFQYWLNFEKKAMCYTKNVVESGAGEELRWLFLVRTLCSTLNAFAGLRGQVGRVPLWNTR
jgi:hypothetical protein